MFVISIGVNHKSAPVTIREKLSFSHNALPDTLTCLCNRPEILSCVIISTCNRTEIYVHVTDIAVSTTIILDMLHKKSGLDVALIKKYIYIYTKEKTVRQLFRVAAGLDSMLLGETQILGQVRDAYQIAQNTGTCDKVINTLFQYAINTGRRVRTETGVDRHAVSISYAALELAKLTFSDLSGLVVLIIGAGKMSELTANYLVASGVSGIIVSNRSFDRAEYLAGKFGGQAVKFTEMQRCLTQADIVVSCTGATHYVLKREIMAEVMHARMDRQIMLIDIAVPRDIEPAVGKLPGVVLYDIDDLKNVIDHNLMERQRAAMQAENMINGIVDDFTRWQGEQYVISTITALKKQGESVKERELTKALSKLTNLNDHDRQVLTIFANSIVNQLLHTPVTKLKEYAVTEQGPLYQEALEKLFNLDATAEK